MKRELEKIKEEYVEEIIELGKDGVRKETLEMMDYLTHTAKSLCAIIKDFDGNSYGRNEYGDSGYSRGYGESYGDNYGESYGNDYGYSARGRGRNARRDSMGRYASPDAWTEKLKEIKKSAPNEQMRHEIERFISRME